MKLKNGKLLSLRDPFDTESSLDLLSYLADVEIKNRAPTRVGASMGRPEKADERRMKPPPHVLFPLGDYGGNQRLINTAVKAGKF